MAIVVPMRKKYKPRNVVEAVVDNVLRLRSNCTTMTNPNTQAQQYVRSRFAFMQALQRELAPLLKRGFNRRLNERERWVGAYHVALGYNMTEAARYDEKNRCWYCHFAHFALAEHQSRAPKRITVQRKGNLLLLSYRWNGQPERTSHLWAVYNRKRKQWVQGIEDTRLQTRVSACVIPPAWGNDPLEVLIGFGRDAQGRGKLRGTHHFSLVKSEGTVTVRGGRRGESSAEAQGSRLAPPLVYTGWRRVSDGTSLWVECTDGQGHSWRVHVLYARE